jgi:hypothetical protein
MVIPIGPGATPSVHALSDDQQSLCVACFVRDAEKRPRLLSFASSMDIQIGFNMHGDPWTSSETAAARYVAYVSDPKALVEAERILPM